MKTFMRMRRSIALFVAFLIFSPSPSFGYSVLTHEAIIDVVWDTNLCPLLLKRFPGTTPDELLKAHAFAYGGAIIQDMGYYPAGNKFFSNLTHYFRSGDFIRAALRDAQNVNDYAFALGALAHYAADNEGHRLATNRAVPLLYPELQKKYGLVVTYEDNPLTHIKTEFGFDVLQVAKGRYASDRYHNFIGFEVSLPLLEQVFRETYGIDLKSVSKDEVRATSSYRYSVSTLVPKATRIAWDLKQDEIQRDIPGATRSTFLYNISRASYENQWGRDYHRPTPGEKFIAFLIRILPKIGPLKILTFRTPTPEAERLFEKSFNATVDRYRELLSEVRDGRLTLPNDNFDVGETTPLGQYKLNDETCDELLHRLSQQGMITVDQDLKSQLLAFYTEKNPSSPAHKRHKPSARTRQEIGQLQSITAKSAASERSSLAPLDP